MSWERVHRGLEAQSVCVSSDWTQRTCVELAKKRKLTQKELEKECYFQFLHCDLRREGVARLPDGIGGWKRGAVSRALVLQIESVEEISGEHAGHKGRTIKLLLTDGTSDVAAFEKRKIDAVQPNMSLGGKLFVKAATNVRRGLLLLTECSTKFLGGAVAVAVPGVALPVRSMYSTLSEASSGRVTCLAFVETLKKFCWSTRHERFLLVVVLRDDTGSRDAIFGEDEFKRLFDGLSSAQLKSLPKDERERADKNVELRLKQYDGAVTLQFAAPSTAPDSAASTSSLDLDKLPEIVKVADPDPAAMRTAVRRRLNQPTRGAS